MEAEDVVRSREGEKERTTERNEKSRERQETGRAVVMKERAMGQNIKCDSKHNR